MQEPEQGRCFIMIENEIEGIRQLMKKKRKKSRKKIPSKNFLSSGATLINLACTGRPGCCFYMGGYFLISGTSDSGKTFVIMTCFAEAARNERFKKYQLIHDNAEGGALMDIEKFFGKAVDRRLEIPPNGTSEYLEDFYYNLDDLYAAKKPFIYVLETMDALDTKADIKHFLALKKKKGDEDAAGSYNLTKPKMNSAGLKRATNMLKKTGSILIVVTQSRDNIGFASKYSPQRRSGGRALKYYARLEIWTSVMKNLKKEVRKKQRQIGINTKIEIKKNHITGLKSSVIVPIYNSYGIDDLGSCIEYLIDEKHWTRKKGIIRAPEFSFDGRKSELIELIEQNEQTTELRMIVTEVWKEILEKSDIGRPRRYT